MSIIDEILAREPGQWTLEEWERIRVALIKGEVVVRLPGTTINFPVNPDPTTKMLPIPAPGTVWIGTTTFSPKTQQPCAIEEYFKKYPDQKVVHMVCTCPKCTISC